MNATVRVWLGHHRAYLRLALRVTVAGLLSFALGHLLGLPQAYWAVLTSVIVMQSSVGGSVKATLDRLLGTLGGAVWGVVVASAIPHTGTISLGLALAASLAPLALLVAFRPAYRVAPITAIIVLLSSRTQEAGALASAVARVLDIGLGGIVAVAVALLVLPARAQRLLAEAAGVALDLMAAQISTLPERLVTAADPSTTRELSDRIRNAISLVEAIAGEAAAERASRLTDAPDPDPVVRTLRRLRHDLTTVSRATVDPLAEPARRNLASPAARASAEVAAFLRAAAVSIAIGNEPPSLEIAEKALDELAAAAESYRRQPPEDHFRGPVVIQAFGLVFALEQLRLNLTDLADRVRELARPAQSSSAS
jgi:uncharacterized membrane protein YccC